MKQRWQMRVRGAQRKEVNKGLLVQALVMLIRQMEAEEQAAAASGDVIEGESQGGSRDERMRRSA